METDRISTMANRPNPDSVRNMQVLFGFTKFNWRFTQKCPKVTAAILILLKTLGSWKWVWTQTVRLLLRNLIYTIPEAHIFHHVNLPTLIFVQTNASDLAIAGTLKQYDGRSICRPVNVYSRQCSAGEGNFSTYNRDLMASIETMKPS